MGLIYMILERVTGRYDLCIDEHFIYTKLVVILTVPIYLYASLVKRKK